MNDLISRADVLEGLKHSTAYLHDDIYTIVNRIPSAETTGALDDAIAQYVADGLMGLPSAEAVQGWIPLSHDGLVTDFPHERDGEWVIVTDGKTISVERIKKDAYDHFFPNGRWFQLEDVVAWIPLPEPYKGGDSE